MNVAEECLKCLQTKDWNKFNSIISDDSNCQKLAESNIFQIFENNLISEIEKNQTHFDDISFIVVARIFQLNNYKLSSLNLSDNGLQMIAKYLFKNHPQIEYAKALPKDKEAIEFLKTHHEREVYKSNENKINTSLNIKEGQKSDGLLSRNIFKSPQEEELFFAAKKLLPNHILLPNTALSTIINDSIIQRLDKSDSNFFLKSTLDLCIVNPETFFPELFIELDSSWHDKPRIQDNDKKKDLIFKLAGLTLFRLRKKQNRTMIEEFELFISTKITTR
jgi:hypothetical protein